MSFLRLGTACAIFDDDGQILLSRRGDLDVWNLPTGRLDSGELLIEGAAREVREETGVIVNVERAVGLYFYQATGRMNVLYAGFPIGGEVVSETDESTGNDYFSPDSLPQNLFAAYMVGDATDETHKTLYIHTTPQIEILKLRLKLAQRYVMNALRGRPEPKHVRFDVRAVAVIWDESHRRILTQHGHAERELLSVQCTGNYAPWVELEVGIQRWLKVHPKFHWVGVWQNPAEDAIEFIFATTVNEHSVASSAEWQTAQNAALLGRDAQYISQIKSTYAQDRVWSLAHQPQSATIVQNL